MMQTIQAVYPKSRLQCSIVHQIFSPPCFVSWKDTKQAETDLKNIYTAVTLAEAEKNLLRFGEAWRRQYPFCAKSQEENWEVLSAFYEYPSEIRKIIYTIHDEYYRGSQPLVLANYEE